MRHFWKRLIGRRNGQYFKALENYAMLTQTKLDEYAARVRADSAKISSLQSQINAADEKSAADAQIIADLNAKLAAVPAAAPELDDTGLDAAVSELDATVTAVVPGS